MWGTTADLQGADDHWDACRRFGAWTRAADFSGSTDFGSFPHALDSERAKP